MEKTDLRTWVVDIMYTTEDLPESGIKEDTP